VTSTVNEPDKPCQSYQLSNQASDVSLKSASKPVDQKMMNAVQYSFEPLLRVAQAFAATPRVMAELDHLLRSPNTDIGDITALLKRDGTLSARLLRIANSAAFGQAEKVASIDDAAALIGFREIHRLVGAVAIDQFSQRNYPLYGFVGQRVRENGLYVALLMEELAKPAKQDPQIAYTIGLFRSIGKLTLEKLAEEKNGVSPYKADTSQDLVLWEKQSFGIPANEATAVILRQWRFPAEISQAIATHYLPGETEESLSQLLNLSTEIVTRLGYGLPGESRYWLPRDEALRRLGIDERQCERSRDRAATAFERWSRAIA